MSNFDLETVGINNLSKKELEKADSYGELVEKAKGTKEWPFKRARGLPKLVNYVRKFLLTTYGSDPERPNYGSYLKNMIGQNYGSLEEVADDINKEVKRVEKQIIEIQTNSDYNIDKKAQLREIRLDRIYRDDNNDLWNVNGDFIVINREGESYEGKLFPEKVQG